MKPQSDSQLLLESKAALRRGDRALARRLAQRAVALNPESLEGWLFLGGLSKPNASLAYLEIARNIAPDDPRVIAAITWAQKRSTIRPEPDQEVTREIRTLVEPQTGKIRPPIIAEVHHPVWLWTLIILVVFAALMLTVDMFPTRSPSRAKQAAPMLAEGFTKPSLTPTATFT
ncbi:MAG: hypothetical protein QM230_01395, partial [Chloroflexota bacterium]|nr:hypothetical protein [Chloroflexota bacterium]